jgi:hypothetical protein
MDNILKKAGSLKFEDLTLEAEDGDLVNVQSQRRLQIANQKQNEAAQKKAKTQYKGVKGKKPSASNASSVDLDPEEQLLQSFTFKPLYESSFGMYLPDYQGALKVLLFCEFSDVFKEQVFQLYDAVLKGLNI